MLYFGSRNFGQANFGKGLITTSVSNSTTSDMTVACHLLFNNCRVRPTAVTNADVASGLLQGGFVHVPLNGTTIVSGIKMFWHPKLPVTVITTNTDASAKLAWDGQTVADTTWTTQTVGD